MKRDDGFTLLEMLIAISILAIAAGGLLAANAQSLRQMQRLESKTQGMWIAESKLSELRASRSWPELGVTKEDVSMAEKQWLVQVSVTQTATDDMRQYVVDVSEGDVPVATLTGFIGRY